MALKTKSINANGSKGHHKFTLNVNEESISTADNTSSLSYSFVLSPVSSGWDWYGWGSNISYSINIAGNTYSGTIPDYNGTSTVTLKSGSNISVAHETDGSKTISISFSVTDNAGQSYTPGSCSKSDTFALTQIDRAPIVSDLSTSSIARTSAGASFTVTNQGATTVSASSIKASLTSGSYSSPVATITGTSSGASGTLSGLTPNTKYYIRGEATNTIGTTYTTESNFTTTGNVPTISSITVSPSKNYATLTGNVTYDTNASFSSVEVQWGTSTSYGNTSNAWRIPASGSTLAQNTTYYYRARVTDNWSRTSSWKTGSFTTSGDNPSITNVVATPALQSCTLTPTVTYATNASFASVSIRYGKTTSYGSTATQYSLSPLDSKQTYYYSMTITDTYGRTSSAYTGSFTTTSSAPWNVEFVTDNITETTVDIGFTFSCGQPDWPTSGTITVSGNGYNQTQNLTWTGNPPDYGFTTFTGLTANKTYTITGSMTNSTGTGAATQATFKTQPTAPSISSATITSSGTTGISISITASGGSGDTLNYRFSKDGGSSWTSTQTGSTYSYTGLTAGSTYNVCFEVRNGDRFVYEYYTITLPTSGSTTNKGLIQYRQDGWWTNVKKIYIAKYSKWLSK